MTTETIRATRVLGTAGTGKTRFLLNRAVAALQETQDKVLLLCASPWAAAATKKQLDAALAAAGVDAAAVAGHVEVTCPREVALRVLATPVAKAQTGREARLLLPFEETFLMEDMKVTGIRPKRLREMLKFFYRTMTELEDDKEGWLLTGEEILIHGLLQRNLASLGAYLEPEISSTAVRFLWANPETAAAFGVEQVLVDDLQCLSKASQLLAQELAKKEITVAGDEFACVETFEGYPYVAGLAEFADTFPNAETVTLTENHRCEASVTAAAGLLRDAAMAGEGAPVAGTAAAPTELVGEFPADEMTRVVAFVKDALAEGSAPSNVVVAAPTGLWSKNLQRALAAAGVPVRTLPEPNPLRGDIRELEASLPARVFAALGFVADSKDSAAWRAWCGFGDYLVHSSTVNTLRERAKEQESTFTVVVEELAAGLRAGTLSATPGEEYVAAAFARGEEIIRQAQGLRGQALLEKLTALVSGSEDEPVPAGLACLCAGAPEDADTATLMAVARANFALPALPEEDAVAVLSYDALTGVNADVVVVTGFVNGFVPCQEYFDGASMTQEKQEKEYAKDIRRVYVMASKADKTLAVSRFTTADLETASRLKLKIDRIRLQNRVRVCNIGPSIFLERMGE